MEKSERPIDILVQLLEKTKQLKVTWRPDLGLLVLPGGVNGVRWLTDMRGWTVPTLNSTELMFHLREQYPDLRVSFDKGAAQVLYEALGKESVSTQLSLAEDGDVPDVLSVPSRPFQRAATAFSLRGLPRKIIALDTGLGKTFVAITYARIRQARVLWVTKAALVHNLSNEIMKLAQQKAYVLKGMQPSVEDLNVLQDKTKQHVIISYESLSRSLFVIPGEEEQKGSLWGMAMSIAGFDLLVVDEAHHIRNRTTKRWKVVNMMANIPSIMFLTADPVVNTGLDLFSLVTILDNKNYSSESEFTRAYMSADGKRVVNQKKLQSDMLPYMFRRKKEDVLKDLPPVIRQHHSIEMNDAFKQAYQDVVDGIFTSWDGNVKSVPATVLAQINRFRQVASYAKVEATVELARTLEEAGEKSLIFTWWRDSAEAIAQQLGCEFIHGGVDKDDRPAIERRFNENPSIKYLVVTMETGGQGLDLTGASACIFNDYAWTGLAHSQAEGRAWGRLNDPHGLLAFYVEVEDSIDSFMMKGVERKQMLKAQAVDEQGQFAIQQESLIKDFMQYVKDNRRI